jgi:hypothetical protein
LAQLFGAIGGVVAVAMIAAWRIRFRRAAGSPAPAKKAGSGNGAAGGNPPAPMPPSAFVAAVEEAIGQEVVALRLRTPTDVFKIEVPGRSA